MKNTIKNTPIDLVYMWCDGNDEDFKNKKNYWLEKEGYQPDKQASSDIRYIQCDELKYSLRSVEKFASWVNHIYIVTDKQIPNWLDTDNPKISIIDHSQIIEQKYLPTFNSQAISTNLWKIKNLSEYFLIANDDTFFGREIFKNFFMTKAGKPIVRLISSPKGGVTLYRETIAFQRKLIKDKYGYDCAYHPCHNISLYLKSSFKSCNDIFKKQFNDTVQSRFRKKGNVNCFLALLYTLATKQGVAKFLNYHSLLNRLFLHYNLIYYDTLYITNVSNLNKISKYRPALFCINDTQASTQENRQDMKNFLEKMFWEKSSFEK